MPSPMRSDDNELFHRAIPVPSGNQESHLHCESRQEPNSNTWRDPAKSHLSSVSEDWLKGQNRYRATVRNRQCTGPLSMGRTPDVSPQAPRFSMSGVESRQLKHLTKLPSMATGPLRRGAESISSRLTILPHQRARSSLGRHLTLTSPEQ